MPRIKANGLTFFYQQSGAGRDVVLLHGVTGNLAIWSLSGLISALAADFRVTAYDFRGHGYSETPPTGYTSADMAEDLRAVHRALGLGPAFVLGHSFGGVVAMHAAALFPEVVAGVVLSDPYFPGLLHLESDISRWAAWDDFRETCRRAGLDIAAETWSDVATLLHQTAALPPDQRALLEQEVTPAGVERLVRLAATTCGEDVQQVAGLTEEVILSVRRPVVALYGEQSPFLRTCSFLVEKLPDCRAAFVPGAKHLAHEENPTAYVALVRQHLREMAGGQP
jgi:2-hydroxy-6-oxonona-2,4-dienedioate hydrolase/2-succinyl-6-hydroxy-2,4-cyclohexadiene-1-carboxylate synthase